MGGSSWSMAGHYPGHPQGIFECQNGIKWSNQRRRPSAGEAAFPLHREEVPAERRLVQTREGDLRVQEVTKTMGSHA